MLISIGGSSIRLRACTDSHPAARPTATPPAETATNLTIPSASEKCPDATPATASLYTVRPVPSLTSASPSRTVEIRSGAPNRRRTEVAAIGSVGPRIAPSTSAAPHSICATSCATTATAPIVTNTSPTASSPIARAWARRSWVEELYDAA